ncbi:MAG TPA: hypothetical protein VNL97_06500 [Solirubrobacterales bacterium]|jgi:uncharacterized repeat protein (TIGR01451 family)|nr:hypothetical protein [Solirubrobacterales bacterium]
MRRSDLDTPSSKRSARYAGLLLLVAVLALAFAALGAAALPGSTDLRITKTDSPDPVNVGSTLTYTIQVQNLGPDAASGVTVTDQLPKGVDFISASATAGQCARKGRKVTCNLGALPAPTVNYATVNYGGPSTVTIAVIPRKAGTISNTASVKGDQKDPVASNDKATAKTRVLGPAASCRGVPATMTGTAGSDTIVGSGATDVIVAFGGNDTIVSLAGRDLICAGRGGDYVGAGSAADRVFGGAGRDRLLGRGGPDVLKGNAGDDVLKGHRGADRLRGGSGFDRCRGGAGVDSIRGCER